MSKKIKEFSDHAKGTNSTGPKRISIKPEDEPNLRKTVFDTLKNKKPDQVIDLGDQVICDMCGKDWTDSKECGGFIFETKAVCPDCAPRNLESIKKYHEEKYIKKFCPEGVTFKDFVIGYRGGKGTIKVYSL